MKKSQLVLSALLFALTVLLSGCLVGIDDNGWDGRDGHRGGHDEGRRHHDRRN